MRSLLTFIFALISLSTLCAQQNFWQDISEHSMVLSSTAHRLIPTDQHRGLQLDFESLKMELAAAPMEFTAAGRNNAVQIQLPLPDGSMETFAVVNSPILAPGIASRYPSIQTYKGRSIKNASVTTRFSMSPRGLHAIISSESGMVMIDPFVQGQTAFYGAYYTRNSDMFLDGFELQCGHKPNAKLEDMDIEPNTPNRNGSGAISLSVYTFGLACSGEYANYHNADTKEEVLAEMTQIVNRANEILQRDVAVRLEIADQTDNAIFLDSGTDPYSDGSDVFDSYEQTPDILAEYIGTANYDVGHSFIASCGAGTVGIGGGNACNENVNTGDFKGFGISCQFDNNNTFAIELVCHEVGHQLSATHTFNNCQGNEQNATPSSAYEPGGGTTIMAYTGSCGSQITQSYADDYYHTINVEQIREYTQNGHGSTCAEVIPTDNNMPTINLAYEDGFQIPISTPFELEAEGGDPDNDEITYCWEQFDLGPMSSIGNPILTAPLFRSYLPTTSPIRVFPRLDKIIANTSDNTEVLPTYTRDLNFRCTVRDNDMEAGGAVWAQVAFKADETAGPFLVTYPSSAGIVMTVGDYNEITWDVANTTNTRVNCHNVDIKLSVDGGFTYPYTLVENTPNDGAAFVTIPDAVTTQARIRVEASDNIFFDISNQNFEIEPATTAGYALEVTPASIPLYCLPAAPLTFDISTTALLGYAMPVSLNLAGDLPAGASANFASEELTPGESTTLTIDLGDFSGRDTFQLQLQGTTDDLGTFERELHFIAVSTDFLGMELQMPANGTEGVFLTTDFSWANISGADSYDFELATSPAFGATVVESAEGLTESNYTPQILLEDDELYFWRVHPHNSCGAGEPTVPFAFHTATVDCTGSQPSDLPISLPSNPNTKTSTIFVAESGTISDINVEDVNINFNPVNSLRITLVGPPPANTEVVLYDLNCLNTSLINLSFDDEAPTDIQCPPASGNPVRPENPLSAFIGENTQGEWQLKVQVVNAGFGSGGINSWGVEFCSTASPTPPSLLTNETLQVPPGQGNPITNSHLEASDDNASDSQIKFILVTVPENGSLYRAGDNEPLVLGESFTQQTINSFNLSYVHDGSATTTDQFIFIVEDGAGGFIPNEVFNIEIDENAMVNTDDLNADNAIELFPNPARDMVHLQMKNPLQEAGQLRVLNAQGQLVIKQLMSLGSQHMDINTSQLASGVYLLELYSGEQSYTEKLIINK